MSKPDTDKLELRVPSKPQYVSIVRALVTDVARRVPFSESAIEDLQVAVSEACANVVRHAYDGGNAEMVICCSLQGSRLIMEIWDNGIGFVEPVATSLDLDKAGGLGLLLIRNLMDHVSLDSSPDHGTVVRMVKRPHRSNTAASKRKAPIHSLL